MFGLFSTPTHEHPSRGRLQRRRGFWRGEIALQLPAQDARRVPWIVEGPRAAPDGEALALTEAFLADAAWQPAVAQALLDHLSPWLEALRESGDSAPYLDVRAPDDAWPHVAPAYLAVVPLQGTLTVELGLHAAWDDEHLLGARLRAGRLLELNGSVLMP
jgi:hypothetical protein